MFPNVILIFQVVEKGGGRRSFFINLLFSSIFSSFLRINFPQPAFLSGSVMLSLTKDLTSESPVATAHSTRNTRYHLFIIPNVNFFCVIVSYSFFFITSLALYFSEDPLKMAVVFFPFVPIVFCLFCTSAFSAHTPHISSHNCHQVDYVNKGKTFSAQTEIG